MIITRTSQISGKAHSMDLDITKEQIEKWENGEVIQKAFPNLTADQREFLISGTTKEEWDKIFSQNETYCEMPKGECPYCGYEWLIDDYTDLKEGDDIECPKCEKIIHISNYDITISFTFTTKNNT